LHLSAAHAVNKHTSQNRSGRVNNTHLRSLHNLLFIARIFLGNILWGLDAERLNHLFSP